MPEEEKKTVDIDTSGPETEVDIAVEKDEAVIDTAPKEETTTEESSEEVVSEEETFHQIIKQKFMEGGPEFMGIVLLCLILGLALAIERIIYLNMATINSDKLLNDVEGALKSGGIDAAKEVC